MYCPNCHKSYDVDYWRCPECGAPLAEKQTRDSSGKQGFGIASMVLGMLALMSVWLIAPAGLFAVLSIIFGIIQLARSKKHGTAIAGLILSVLAIIATCVYILLIVMSADIMTDSRWYDDENFIGNERPEIEYNLENPGDL
ncbi:hypothetical protein [Frisingicoccus sp.]|jgi:hypothetical protein|uniref:DUF4190 domain-containing protein n=1 Tax=Frisingicoccus sp. TaxID=1918627 RepID=UPI003AB49EF7